LSYKIFYALSFISILCCTLLALKISWTTGFSLLTITEEFEDELVEELLTVDVEELLTIDVEFLVIFVEGVVVVFVTGFVALAVDGDGFQVGKLITEIVFFGVYFL